MTDARKRDAEATKSLVLAAAEKLFAESGFSGTSISRIAKGSGVSGALILFHFKDKQGLYQAVKASIIQRYSECLPAPIESAETLPSILHNTLRAMFLYYRNNPTMTRLANWGRLEGDSEPWPGEAEWHHRYISQIQIAQEKGEVRRDITPMRALVIITGAIHLWWEYHDHMVRDLGQSDDPEAADDGYFEELKAVLLRGLEPGVPHHGRGSSVERNTRTMKPAASARPR